MTARILVVEDNEKNLTLIRDVLEYHGYEVLIARDGAAGVALAKQFPPDVALIDIQMPVMDGLTASAAIRNREADTGRARTPIVALTANAMAHQVEQYITAGMDGHVAKPIQAAELFEALTRLTSPETAAAEEVAA